MRRVALAAAVAGLGLAIIIVAGRERAQVSSPRAAEPSTPIARRVSADEPASTLRDDATSTPSESDIGRRARKAGPEAGESDRSARWDRLSPAERVDALREALGEALGAIESGDRDPHHLLAAQDALSALRVELYGNERGRAAHAAYEDRLDRAMQERPEAISTPPE
jgi:predicted lipid-binding transport protein (Tim44 family)